MPAPSPHASRAPGPVAPPSSRYTIDPLDHLDWARMIARGVGHRFGFHRGSEEEQDLISTAYVAVCDYALRFDAVTSYRRGAAVAIAAACRRWRTNHKRPAHIPGPVLFDGRNQRRWVASVVAPVAAARRFAVGSRERRALMSLAVAVARDRVANFDPVGAFRGYAAIEVRSQCQWASYRLRNGGTFHKCENPNELKFQVLALPGQSPMRDEYGDEPDLPRQLLWLRSTEEWQ